MWYASYLVKSAMAANLNKLAAPQGPLRVPPKPPAGSKGLAPAIAPSGKAPNFNATNMAMRGAGASVRHTEQLGPRARSLAERPMPEQPAGAQSPFLDPVSAHPGMALGLGLGTAGLGYLTGNALYDAAGGRR